LNPEELPDKLQTDEPSQQEAIKEVREMRERLGTLETDITDK